MSNKFLSGPQPQGTVGQNVPFIHIQNRNPTQYDVHNYYLMDQWLNTVNLTIWVLVSRNGTNISAGPLATWFELAQGTGTVVSLTSNAGGPILPVAGNINVRGDGVFILGTGVGNTITFSLIGGATFATQFTALPGGTIAVPALNNINFIGAGGTVVTAAGSTVTITSAATGTTQFNTDVTSPALPIAGIIQILMNDGANVSGITARTIAVGNVVGISLSDTNGNTILGNLAGLAGYTGTNNTSLGSGSLRAITSGSFNTAEGTLALSALTTGNRNLALGYQAGENYTGAEANNILLENNGVLGESNAIHIGTQGSHATAYIAGVTGVNVGSVASLVSIATGGGNVGQLGTTVITAGAGVTITPGANTITIASTSVGAAVTFATDAGNAVPTGAGVINIISGLAANNSGATVSFTGALNTVTLNVTDAVSGNTFIGLAAGNGAFIGGHNTFFGNSAGHDISLGANNSLFGYNNGVLLTTGNLNSSFGESSLEALTTGSGNSVFGAESAQHLVTGSNNLILGSTAGNALTGAESNNLLFGIAQGVVGISNLVQMAIPFGNNFMLNYGTNNTFLGDNSGNITLTIATSTNNTGVGRLTLHVLAANAANNTAIGSNAGAAISTSSYNTAVGSGALSTETTSPFNTAIGGLALTVNHGTNNTSLGYNAGGQVATGAYNVFLGQFAGFNYNAAESSDIMIGNNGVPGENHVIRIGTFGVGNGQQNLSFIAGLLTTDDGLTALAGNIVANAGQVNSGTTMSAGTGLTVQAGGATIVAGNVHVQNGDIIVDAGRLVLPATNVAGTQGTIVIGATRFLADLNAGNENTAVGLAGNLTMTGDTNTLVGNLAGESLTTGNANTLIGAHCGEAITTGSANTLLGFSAGLLLTSGIQNVLIGQVGSSPTTGSNNVLIGYDAGNNYTAAESSNIVIIDPAVNGENNTIRIGTSGVGAREQNRCFVAGIRGITTGNNDAIAVLIDSAGQLGTISSSRRYKSDIQDLGSDTDKIMQLRPVSFKFHGYDNRSVGFIAEEVEEIMPELVAHDKDGMVYSVKYNDIIPMLLNELQKTNKKLQAIEERLNKCSMGC